MVNETLFHGYRAAKKRLDSAVVSTQGKIEEMSDEELAKLIAKLGSVAEEIENFPK